MKILIAGLGGIGQRHVRNLRTILGSDLELIAYRVRGLTHVVTPQLDVDISDHVERKYDIGTFADLDEALAQRPDAAFITNPSSLHIETSLRCVENGCDVFVEKPLANSLLGVDTLIDVVNRKHRVGMVGYQLRFHPGVKRLAQILESGALGHLLSVRATIGEYLPNWHRYEDYRTMYAARSELGGGVILSQIHELDYIYSLFGLPARVFALGGHWSDLEIDVEDTASILLECVSEGRSLPVHIHQDYLQLPAQRSCEVVGDKGRALLDFQALSLTTWSETGAVESERYTAFERNELFVHEVEHFLACVANRQRPVIDLHEGLQSLRIALAVKESIAKGSIVELSRGEYGFADARN